MAHPISAPGPPVAYAGSAPAPWGRPLISELLDSIPDPVIGCDANGFVVYWSRAATEIYGYAPAEAIGQRVITLLRTRFPLPLLEIMEEVTDVGRWQGKLVHRAKDGGQHTVESRWVSRYDEHHKLVGGFGIERELLGLDERERERVLLEADQERPVRELRHAERLESLSQMAGGVAHDFNNALAIIINYAAFIAGELEAAQRMSGDVRSAAMRQDLAEIQTAAEHAAGLTQQLLAISRQASEEPVALNLNESIGEIAELMTQTVGDGIRVVMLLAERLHPVNVDPGQLHEVLINLAANAREAMPRGGTLTIDTANADPDDVSGTAQAAPAPGTYVRLRVSDTGVGMAPEVLERAFDPFFTTNPVRKATGLGLSSVHGIITRAGGHARLRSDPGIGTTFVALLPAAHAARRRPAEPQPVQDGSSGSETILLVEDERALLEVVRRILSGAGYSVIAAVDGPTALEAAAAHDGLIDILLTDVEMPEMLGHELADRLRAARPGIRVMYMSGLSVSVLGAATRSGKITLIDKPFTAPALLESVREAMTQAPGR